jgi:hypothetical protein
MTGSDRCTGGLVQRQGLAVARRVVLLAMAALLSAAAAAEVSFAVDAGLRWEDNIGFSSRKDDKVEDFTFEIGAGVDWAFIQTATTEMGIHGGVYHNEVDDVSDISKYGFEGSARYRGQSSGDLTAFWWKLDGEIRTLKHRESEIRDGYIWEVGATIGKRFNQRFGISGGYRYEQRKSTEDTGEPAHWRANDVFDLKKNVLFINGDIALGPVTTLSLEFTYKDGDEASTGRLLDWYGWLGDTIPWGRDPAFGPDYEVWRVDAKQYIYDVSLSHSFNERFSIDGGYSYVDAEGDAGVWGPADYTNNVLTATVTFQF